MALRICSLHILMHSMKSMSPALGFDGNTLAEYSMRLKSDGTR
jgi:hypothetical protein